MHSWRLKIALLLFIVPSLWVTLTGQGAWPFTEYKMYTKRYSRMGDIYQIQVRQQDGEQRDLLKTDFLLPLKPYCLSGALKRVQSKPPEEGEKQLLRYYGRVFEGLTSRKVQEVRLIRTPLQYDEDWRIRKGPGEVLSEVKLHD